MVNVLSLHIAVFIVTNSSGMPNKIGSNSKNKGSKYCRILNLFGALVAFRKIGGLL